MVFKIQGYKATKLKNKIIKKAPQLFLFLKKKGGGGPKINDWPKILIYQYNLTSIYIKMGQEVLQLYALYFYLFRGKIPFK